MTCHARLRLLAALPWVLGLAPVPSPSPCRGQEIATPARRTTETADLGDGRRVAGKIVDGMPAGTFRFAPEDGGEPIPLERVSEIAIDGSISDPTSAPAPFRVHLGTVGRISGRLVRLDPSSIVPRRGAGADAPGDPAPRGHFAGPASGRRAGPGRGVRDAGPGAVVPGGRGGPGDLAPAGGRARAEAAGRGFVADHEAGDPRQLGQVRGRVPGRGHEVCRSPMVRRPDLPQGEFRAGHGPRDRRMGRGDAGGRGHPEARR